MHTLSSSRLARELAYAALLFGLLMAQLDGNIVVAALPTIADDLQTTSATSVFAVYLLAVTVTTPLHAALGDMLGRRMVFIASVVVFAVGSLACALAPSVGALLVARAFQGVGGGGLVITAIATTGEMFDSQERIRRQIWATAVFALSLAHPWGDGSPRGRGGDGSSPSTSRSASWLSSSAAADCQHVDNATTSPTSTG